MCRHIQRLSGSLRRFALGFAAAWLTLGFGLTAQAGLVAYWNFDDTFTPYADSGPEGSVSDDGTVPAGRIAPTQVAGVFGNALAFNGTNSTLNMGSSPDFDTPNYTASTWLWADASNGWRTAMGSWYGGNMWMHLGIDGNVANQWSDYSSNAAAVTRGGTATTGQWFHIVSVRNSGVTNGLELWVNGNRVAQATGTVPSALGDYNVWLGTKDGAGNWWSGKIDDAAIWNAGLTAGKVRSLYTVPTSGIPVLASYGVGTMNQLFAAYDSSGSATVGDLTWSAATFAGHNPGDVWIGGNNYNVQFGASDGVSAPLPSSTWTGGALPADNNWQSPGNWGGTAPAAGNVLHFDTAKVANNNDFPANTTFAGINFKAGAGAFNLSGNAVNLMADVINNSPSTQTISLPVFLDGPACTFNAAAGDIVVTTPISEANGSRGLTKVGPGTLTLGAANTYTGATTINAGAVRLADPNAVASSTLNVNTNNGLRFANGLTAAAVGGLAGSGNVALQTTDPAPQPVALTVGANNATTTFSGGLSGTGSLSKTGSGVLQLMGTNTHTGGTNVNAGYLVFGSATAVPAAGSITAATGGYAGAAFAATSGNFFNQFNKAATSGVVGLEATPTGPINLTGFNDAVRLGTRTAATLDTTNPLTPAGSTYRLGGGGGILTIKGGVLTGSRDVEIGASGTLPAGVVLMAGTNNYTGATNITAGILRLPSVPPPVANPAIWLDATDSTTMTIAGGKVAEWRDKAGGAGKVNQANAVLQPSFATSGADLINGLPVVKFTPNQLLSNTTNYPAGVSVFYVSKLTSSAGGRLFGGTSNNWLLGYWNAYMDSAWFDGNVSLQTTTPRDNIPHMYGAVIPGAGSNSSAYVYDTRRPSVYTIAQNQGGVAGPMGISLGGSNNEYTSGNIGEVLIYNSALSDADRALVQNYLITKWFTGSWSGTPSDYIPDTSAVTISAGATLDVASNAETIGLLSGEIGSTVALAGGTLTTGGSGDTEFAGTINGSGRLVKTGAGVLTLTGNNAFAGTTTISAGTLQVGYGGTTGALTGNIANNGTLIVNRSDDVTYAGVLSGNGTASQHGSGVLVLTGANINGGATTVNAGVLRANDRATTGAATGVSAATNVTLTGGVWEIGNSVLRGLGMGAGQVQVTGGTSGFSAYGAAVQINLGSGANVQWGSAAFNPAVLVLNAATANNTLDFQNVLDLNTAAGSPRTITVESSVATISQQVKDTGAGAGLTKTGRGVLALPGLNTYSGPTTVSAGTLRANDTVTGGIFGMQTSTNIVLNDGVWESGNNITRPAGTAPGQVQITGGMSGFSAYGAAPVAVNLGGARAPLVWGDATFNPAILVLNAATSNQPLDFQNALDLMTAADSPRLIAVSANNATISGAISDTGTGAGLVKTGLGTLTLGGSSGNTYPGTTMVFGGSISTGLCPLVLAKAAGNAIPGDLQIGTDAGPTRGFVVLSGNEQIADAGIVTFKSIDAEYGFLSLRDYTETIAGLNDATGRGIVENNEAGETTGTGTLIVKNSVDCAYNGYFRNNDHGAGALALVKDGPAVMTLAGPHVNHTGPTTVNGGTLKLDNATAFNSPVTIGPDGTLEFASSAPFKGWMYSKALSGSGTVNKTGVGDVRVYGAVSLTGQINIQEGEIGNDNLMSNWNACMANMNIADLGSLDLRGDNATVNSLSGTGLIRNSYGRMPSQGSSTNVLTVGVAGGGGTFSGTIQDIAVGGGQIAVTKSGAGTQIFSGGNIMYHGPTTVNAGTLRLADTTGFGSPIATNATVELAADVDWTVAKPISGTGAVVKTGSGTVVLGAASSYAGPTTISGGTLRLSLAPLPTTPVAGSTLWLDAADSSDASVVVVDGRVETWKDKSGSGWDVSQFDNARQPLYTTSGSLINAHNVVTIGGNVLYLANPSFSLASPYTVFTVAKADALPTTAWQTILDGDTAFRPYVGINATMQRVAFGMASSSAARTNPEVWTTTTSGSATDGFWVNGQLASIGTNGNGGSGAVWTQGLRIGFAGNNTAPWTGSIAEVLIYPGTMSDADRQSVESYLMYKWLGQGATDNVLPAGTAVNVTASGAELDLNGVSQRIASLSGVRGSRVTLGQATLTVAGDSGSTEFAGDISGAGGLAKTGGSTLKLSGTVTYQGGTTVDGGTLQIASAGALPAGRSVTIGAGGTLVLSSRLSAAAGQGFQSGASAAPVPEPGTLVLLATAAAVALGAIRRRAARR